MSAREFFQTFAELLEKNPPHPQDAPLMRRLKRIGIVPGKVFQGEAPGAEGLKALEEGAKVAASQLATLAGQGTTGDRINGWSLGFSGAVGRYGIRYQARAEVARLGLGALPPEEATYFSCCQHGMAHSLDGAHVYTLHCLPGQLPPVRAFWSLTMYGGSRNMPPFADHAPAT